MQIKEIPQEYQKTIRAKLTGMLIVGVLLGMALLIAIVSIAIYMGV